MATICHFFFFSPPWWELSKAYAGARVVQDNRIIEVGRDLLRSSNPDPLLRGGQLEDVAQVPCLVRCFYIDIALK